MGGVGGGYGEGGGGMCDMCYIDMSPMNPLSGRVIRIDLHTRYMKAVISNAVYFLPESIRPCGEMAIGSARNSTEVQIDRWVDMNAFGYRTYLQGFYIGLLGIKKNCGWERKENTAVIRLTQESFYVPPRLPLFFAALSASFVTATSRGPGYPRTYSSARLF